MANAAARGRDAETPTEIPKPGWRDILLRTKDEMTADHVTVVAAGVAFFGLVAIFPAIAALFSIAGLVIDPASLEAQLSEVTAALPENAAAILEGQAEKVASGAGAGVGLAALFGIALALFSASKGMKTLMEGMNIAYDEEESRGFLMLNVTAILLTLLLMVGLILGLGMTIALPPLLEAMGLDGAISALIGGLRWLVLAALTVFGLAVLYRFGPSREDPQWKWVSSGALAATVIWILATIAFSIYASNFGSYNETYGTLGGVIILLTWLWISAVVVLLGAELNSEIEHQTKRDTTTGEPRPIGERGAVKADTVGQQP